MGGKDAVGLREAGRTNNGRIGKEATIEGPRKKKQLAGPGGGEANGPALPEGRTVEQREHDGHPTILKGDLKSLTSLETKQKKGGGRTMALVT